MDAKKAIKKYVGRAARTCLIWGGILAALSLFCLFTADVTAGIVMLLVFALPCFLSWFFMDRSVDKALQVLIDAGQIGYAANELEGPSKLTLGGNKLTLTQHFLFSTGGVVLRYTDVALCYNHLQRYMGIPLSTTLVAGTFQGKMMNLLSVRGKDKKRQTIRVMEEIASRNARVMVGYTAENLQTFNQIKKAAKAAK